MSRATGRPSARHRRPSSAASFSVNCTGCARNGWNAVRVAGRKVSIPIRMSASSRFIETLNCARMRAPSSRSRNGRTMKSSAPESRPATTSSSEALSAIRMTGCITPRRRIRATSSRPVASGRALSTSTMSGLSARPSARNAASAVGTLETT